VVYSAAQMQIPTSASHGQARRPAQERTLRGIAVHSRPRLACAGPIPISPLPLAAARLRRATGAVRLALPSDDGPLRGISLGKGRRSHHQTRSFREARIQGWIRPARS